MSVPGAYDGCCRFTVPLARRDQCPGWPVLVVLALLALEVGVDGVRDEPVGAAGLILLIIAARCRGPVRAIRSRSPHRS